MIQMKILFSNKLCSNRFLYINRILYSNRIILNRVNSTNRQSACAASGVQSKIILCVFFIIENIHNRTEIIEQTAAIDILIIYYRNVYHL